MSVIFSTPSMLAAAILASRCAFLPDMALIATANKFESFRLQRVDEWKKKKTNQTKMKTKKTNR